MIEDFKEKDWWNFLEEDLQELLSQSFVLIDFFKDKIEKDGERFHDYSFIVFASAKAYEGFLKKIFLDKGFISEDDYFGKKFRIGKALNPFLPKEMEKDSVYRKICNFTGNSNLADSLWETWKTSRNLIFNWFPREKNAIDFEESERRVRLIIDSIDKAYAALIPHNVTTNT